jgi:hypothetical protein
LTAVIDRICAKRPPTNAGAFPTKSSDHHALKKPHPDGRLA